MRITRKIAGIAFLILLTFTGCSKADKLSSIQVTPYRVSLLSGGQQPLDVTALYKSGQLTHVSNWTAISSEPGIAFVDKNGYVNAGTAGSANLTVTYNESGVSKTFTVSIDVYEAPKWPTGGYVSE